MKITDVECLILDRAHPFVRIYTDEGLVGIGECFRRQPAVIRAVVETIIKPVLLGKDPVDTELRWRDMIRVTSSSDMGGAVYCAIAGLDIARNLSILVAPANPGLGLQVYSDSRR